MVKRFASASVLVVLVFAAASGANAFTSDKRTYFTFNQPVALPGVTLPAGTYMFRIADPQESRKVIQVADKKGTTSYALLHTMPAYRADAPKDSEIRFRETAAGAPPAVGVWWYMGERNGYEFIYTKEQLAALNKSAQPAPAVAESNAAVESPAAVPPIQDASESHDVVDGAGVPPVEEPAEAEAQIAQAQPEQPPVAQPTSPASESRNEARERLPQTASPLALLLLSGIATASFGVKLLRKS